MVSCLWTMSKTKLGFAMIVLSELLWLIVITKLLVCFSMDSSELCEAKIISAYINVVCFCFFLLHLKDFLLSQLLLLHLSFLSLLLVHSLYFSPYIFDCSPLYFKEIVFLKKRVFFLSLNLSFPSPFCFALVFSRYLESNPFFTTKYEPSLANSEGSQVT